MKPTPKKEAEIRKEIHDKLMMRELKEMGHVTDKEVKEVDKRYDKSERSCGWVVVVVIILVAIFLHYQNIS